MTHLVFNRLRDRIIELAKDERVKIGPFHETFMGILLSGLIQEIGVRVTKDFTDVLWNLEVLLMAYNDGVQENAVTCMSFSMDFYVTEDIYLSFKEDAENILRDVRLVSVLGHLIPWEDIVVERGHELLDYSYASFGTASYIGEDTEFDSIDSVTTEAERADLLLLRDHNPTGIM